MASYLLPAAGAVLVWKRLSTPQRIFGGFCVYSVGHIIAERILAHHRISNQSLSNYFQLIELECLVWLFSRTIERGAYRTAFTAAGMFYFLFWLYEKMYFESPDRFSDAIMVVASLLLIIAATTTLTTRFRQSESLLTGHAIFWIASGVLLYNAGVLGLFVMSNVIAQQGKEYFRMMWQINLALTIIVNVMYARSYRCTKF